MPWRVEYAGGRTVYHLILNAAYINTAVPLVIDKSESASVGSTLFAACQYKVMSLSLVMKRFTPFRRQQPLHIFGGLEHNTLQIASGIGLGKVH